MASKTLGERVRDLREATAMSQAQLAERAGMAVGYLAIIEGGQLQRVSPAIVQRLARALNVHVERLVDGK